jgi:hypothetical protein
MHKVLLETGLGQGRRLIVLIYPTGTSRTLGSIWLVDLESRILADRSLRRPARRTVLSVKESIHDDPSGLIGFHHADCQASPYGIEVC